MAPILPRESMVQQLQDVVALVNTLYAPSQERATVLAVQQTLQRYQRSDDACTLAHELLHYDGEGSHNVQFFGALTYTVYISQHANTLVGELADTIVQEIIDACSRKLAPVVINKLVSNLGKLYAKIGYAPMDVLLEQLANVVSENSDFYLLTLQICKIFAEELNRVEDMTAERNKIVIEFLLNKITKRFLNETVSMLSNEVLKKSWLDCVEEWINYLSKSEFEFEVKVDMNVYVQLTIEMLTRMNDGDALNLITNIYDTNPSMINHDNRAKLDTLIFSEWSFNFINQADTEEKDKLSRFITLFLDTNMVALAAKMVDPAFNYKFEYLLHLTNQPGDPISDEPFSVNMLDFWILFTEDIINDTESIFSILKDDPLRIQEFKGRTKSYFLQLCEIYWRKSHLISDWQDYIDEFNNYRRDVGELYESLFTITQGEIFHTLISNVPGQLGDGDVTASQLREVEASTFLITCLANVMNGNNATEMIRGDLDFFFTSNYLGNVSQFQLSEDDTMKHLQQYIVKNTTRLLSDLAWFYESSIGSRHVKSVLVFLFANLSTRSLQDASSKAILLIVDSCRSELSSLLNDFETAAFQILGPMMPTSNVDVVSRSRIIRSYASILQTVRDPQIVASKVNVILLLLQERVRDAFTILANGQGQVEEDTVQEYIKSMAASAVGLAKGLQLPQDWEDYYEGELAMEEMRKTWEYWNHSTEAISVHDQCYQFAKLLTFPTSDESLVEQVCLMFKAGLTEPLSGPFVIPVDQVVEYIMDCCQYYHQRGGGGKKSGTLSKVIELYGTVVKCSATSTTIAKVTGLDTAVPISSLRLSEVIDALISQRGNLEEMDTDILQSIFTMLGDICGCYPGEILTSFTFERVFELAIKLLSECSQERFVVQAVTRFWTQLIYLRKGKRIDVERMQEVFSITGERIVIALMSGFLKTPRSCMEFYSDVWRSLAAKYSQFLEHWIVNACGYVRVIDVELGRKFGKQLALTRGQRSGVRIIKEFWLTATGMVDYGM